MSPSRPSDSSGRTFIVVAFLSAGIVGVVVAYLGITGAFGGPIP